MNKILLTLLIGIGVGILIAPAKGSDTLQKIRDNFDDLKDKLKEGIDDTIDGKNGIKKSENEMIEILD
jgi:gas vesicle protein